MTTNLKGFELSLRLPLPSPEKKASKLDLTLIFSSSIFDLMIIVKKEQNSLFFKLNFFKNTFGPISGSESYCEA